MFRQYDDTHTSMFQDWISTTENVLAHTKVEDKEEVCVIEEQEDESTQAEEVEAQENLPWNTKDKYVHVCVKRDNVSIKMSVSKY